MSAEQGEQKIEKKFSIDSALHNEEFLDFLAKYDESKQLEMTDENEAELAQRFEVFEHKNELTKDLKGLYRNEIAEDTGLKLEDEDLAAVEEEIEKTALENPEEIERLIDQHKEFQEGPERIARKEKELKELGGREELAGKASGLETREEVLEAAKKTLGFFNVKNSPLVGRWFQQPAERAARKRTKEEYGVALKPKNVEQELGKIAEELEKTKGVISTIDTAQTEKERLEGEYAKVRKMFLQDFEPVKAIAAVAKERVHSKLLAFAQGEDLKTLEAGQVYLDKLKNAKDVMGIEYLEGLKIKEGEKEAEFQEQLDKMIDAQLYSDMEGAVEKLLLKKTSFSQMEKTLAAFLAKEKKIGSREGDRAKEALRKIFGDLVAREKDTKKKILLKRIYFTAFMKGTKTTK